jgi:hypothetical protein
MGKKGIGRKVNTFLYAKSASSAMSMRAIAAISLHDSWVFALSIFSIDKSFLL